MKFERDPRDRRYPERLTGSFLASLLLHALLAALLFSVLASSSQEGATESVAGRRSRDDPAHVADRRRKSTGSRARGRAAFRTCRSIAPLHHAPLAQPQAQRLPVNRHELAKSAPTAPPNPRPIPQQTPQPNPQPTQNVFETHPRNEIPAAPVSVPTVGTGRGGVEAAADRRSVARFRRAHPSRVRRRSRPHRSCGQRARARRRRRHCRKPRRPPPPLREPPLRRARARLPRRAPRSRPRTAPACRTRARRAPRRPSREPPGRHRNPGPAAALHRVRDRVRPQRACRAPARPIAIRSDAGSGSRRHAAPRRRSSAPNINAKLRALLPNNPVNPTSKSYTPTLLAARTARADAASRRARENEIHLRRARHRRRGSRQDVGHRRAQGRTDDDLHGMARSLSTGRTRRIRRRGRPRVNRAEQRARRSRKRHANRDRREQAQPRRRSAPFDAGIAPIVDGMVSQPCDGRRLVPYAPSPVSSP